MKFCFRQLCFISVSKLLVFASPTMISISLRCLISFFILPCLLPPSIFSCHCYFPSLPSIFTPNFSFLQSLFNRPLSFLLMLPLPQAVVDGSETSVVLDHLSSLTEYQLAVFAVYANEASEALRGSETTCMFTISEIQI